MVKEYRKILDLEELIQESRKQENVGYELAQIHTKLGNIVGEDLALNISTKREDTTIVVIMRAGWDFANGIRKFFPKVPIVFKWEQGFKKEEEIYLHDRNIIVVDSVINTGKSILPIIELLKPKNNRVVATTIVINDKAVPKLEDVDLYTVRISSNSYVGTKSVDTGNRLFNTVELE
ncbi:uracil phosphoribosyltransferase [Intestinibacter sp.]